MQGIDKSQLQRLEQESARFTNEIKQKENENKQLKQEIDKIKRQLKESKKTYDGIAKVRLLNTSLSILHFPLIIVQYNIKQLILLNFREEQQPLINN